MQLRNIGTPLLIFTVAAGFTIWIWWSRHPFLHVRDLFQSARTYIKSRTVHLDLANYPTKTPDTISDCIPPSYSFAPKIIHQILLNEHQFHNGDGPTRFDKYESARNSCIGLHPDWEYKLWTEENATDWVHDHYPAKKYPFDDTPEVYEPYIHYRQTIQRTNILRYLLLHHYGGVYLDVDITCREKLDPLLRYPFLTPAAHPAGINNAFMVARPGHPFLAELIEQVPKHNLTWMGFPYVENMLSTGCMFISNTWVNYMRRNKHKCKDRLYILADEHNNTTSHMLRGKVTTPLFRHGGESSWHKKDAAFIFWLDKHWKPALAVYFLLSFISLCLLTFLACHKRPCWLGGRCRDRGACRYTHCQENPKKQKKTKGGDVEQDIGGADASEADDGPSNSLASNVAMHTTSNPRESDANGSLGSDATIRPTRQEEAGRHPETSLVVSAR